MTSGSSGNLTLQFLPIGEETADGCWQKLRVKCHEQHEVCERIRTCRRVKHPLFQRCKIAGRQDVAYCFAATSRGCWLVTGGKQIEYDIHHKSTLHQSPEQLNVE